MVLFSKFVIFFLFIYINAASIAGEIRINEVSASNAGSYRDEWYKTPDWIELYNSSNKLIDIGGYRIGDKNNYSKGWVFPPRIMAPGEYLLLHADSRDCSQSDNYIVQAYGAGIYPSLEHDSFSFHYLPVSGDFEIEVRVNSMTGVDLMAKAGIIARTSLTTQSRFFGFFCANPSRNLFSIFMRSDVGSKSIALNHISPIDFPYCWLKLTRRGDSLFCSLKPDCYNWIEVGKYQMQLTKQVFLGIACSAGDYQNLKRGNFSFSELYINGVKTDFLSLKQISIPDSIKATAGYSKSWHSNFSLDAGGGSVFLWNREGKVIDSLTYGRQLADVSYSRYPDGKGAWYFTAPPTPGLSNTLGMEGFCIIPEINPKSGFHSDTVLSYIEPADSNYSIHYTLNGTIPDTGKKKYTVKDKISITETNFLRAISADSAKIPSLPATCSYIFFDKPDIPLISIVSDSSYLWAGELGLLADGNSLADWEVPAHFDFWIPGAENPYSADAGLKLHGQASRDIPQRSFRLTAGHQYGQDKLNFPFWGNAGQQSCDAFILKNAGQDWYYCFIKDAFAWALSTNLRNVLSFAFKPAVVYINGNYWGLYQLRERFDDDYLADKYSIEKSRFDILENNSIKNGSAVEFFEKTEFLKHSNLADDSSFSAATAYLDTENIIEHTIMRTYAGVYDWPCYNNKVWHSEDMDGKWRWILHDLELSFGTSNAFPDINMFRAVRESDCYTADVINKMLENEKFRNKFLNKYADCLN